MLGFLPSRSARGGDLPHQPTGVQAPRDLQTANMLKHHRLAKRISDAGWAQFLSILAAKAAYAGRRVVAVPPAYTSQTCSGCGVLVEKGLSVRWHLPGVRHQPASRPQRREEHRKARAAPSGRRGVGRVGEPRIPGFSRVECQCQTVAEAYARALLASLVPTR